MSRLSMILACVLPALAVASWWAYGNATDTARFMATAAPLATDATVQREVVDELVAVADRQLARTPLPAAQRASARARIRTQAEAVVQSSAFATSWRAILRTAHARLAARLDGNVTAPLTLDLAPVADVLQRKVRAVPGLATVADAIVDPAPVVLLDREQVRRAHQATDRIRIVRGIAIPAAVLALLGVLLTAGTLARGLVRAGLCLGVSSLLLIGAGALARGAIVSGGTAGDLRLAVYDVLTDPLTGWVVGGLIAAVALVAAGAAASALSRGPARPARGA